MILERITLHNDDEKLQDIINELNAIDEEGEDKDKKYGMGYETEHFVFEFIFDSDDIKHIKKLLNKAIEVWENGPRIGFLSVEDFKR